jgi:RsiW-degrading membrane proteinase PrsW (M82 family)
MPHFTLPLMAASLLYMLAALLPAVLLLRFIYRQDRVEKEPAGLLALLLAAGVAAAACAGVLERPLQWLLGLLFPEGGLLYTGLLAFVGVALVEEGAKFWLLRRLTWNSPHFDYRFDAVVYAVFLSLGFAAIENIRYVQAFGLSVALPRGLLAVPAHMCFGVFMGIFYGRAKLRAGRNDQEGVRLNFCWAFGSAVVLHGVYDFCLMLSAAWGRIVFLVFIIFLYRRVYHLVRKESSRDRRV